LQDLPSASGIPAWLEVLLLKHSAAIENGHSHPGVSDRGQTHRGCRISKYFCWAAALLSAQNGIEISYGSDAIL